MVAGHLVEALLQLGLKRYLINEEVQIVGKLRKVFEEGARLYGGPHCDTPGLVQEPPVNHYAKFITLRTSVKENCGRAQVGRATIRRE